MYCSKLILRIFISCAFFSCSSKNNVASPKDNNEDGGNTNQDSSRVFTKTYHKKGETLILTNQDKNLESTVKNRLVNTFFIIYPKEKNDFNSSTTDTVKVTINITYSGVAYTSGGATVISAAWFHNHPQDTDVMTHEAMHIVQAYPSNGGNPGWLVEGIADYARYKYGINNSAAGWQLPGYSSNQSYKDSYRVTARFLVWISQHYDQDFVKKLDKKMRNKNYSADLWKEYTGKPVKGLWEAYGENPTLTTKK